LKPKYFFVECLEHPEYFGKTLFLQEWPFNFFWRGAIFYFFEEKQLCQQILNLEGAKINFICGGGGWRKWLYFTFLKKTNYVTKFYTQKMQKLNNLTLQFFNEKFLFRIDSKKNYFFMQKNVGFFCFS
jgi:hypothetical protein